MTIYHTTNYSQFKIAKENREIRGQKILNSIRIKNLLPEKPILVTPEMQVLDGQHRLWAAQQLQLPIYYTISREEIGLQDLARLNIQRPWGMTDYLNLYKHQNPNYSFLDEILTKYNLDLYLSFVIKSLGYGIDCGEDFRKGTYKLKDTREKLEMRMEKVFECYQTFSKVFKSPRIVNADILAALWWTVDCLYYNHDKFIKKIKSSHYKDDFRAALEYRKRPRIQEEFKKIILKGESKEFQSRFSDQ